MKIAVISFYEAFPPVCGAASVSYNTAKYFPGEKYLIQLSNERGRDLLENDTTLINLPCSFDNPLKKIVDLLLRSRELIKHLRKISPEIIVLEGAAWTLYYLAYFYLIRISGFESKIIYHAHNVEYLLRKEKNSRIIALITKWAEARLAARVDLFTAVSNEDAKKFRVLYGITPSIFPNGVDVEQFEKVTDKQINHIKSKYGLTRNLILFMGLSSFTPNTEGIDSLVSEIFPSVVRTDLDARLVIIGGVVSYKRKWLINPGVIPFEELPAFIKACDVCVAPILSGSGTRLKILEYMAAGKPVVSTTKGAEGLLIRNRENIIIADEPRTFAEGILFLLKTPGSAEKLGSEGKKMVRANYSWQKIIDDFQEIIPL